MTVESRSWDEIADFYRDLVQYNPDMQPMLRLVEKIAASDYASGIYATTSVSTLCIAQTPRFEFDRNMLRVELGQGRFIFSYRELPYANMPWQKECESEEGFSTFIHVMNRLSWFLK